MNKLMSMDPWGILDDLLDTGSRTFRTMRAHATGRFPPVNVFLDNDAVMIDVELPGKVPSDIDLSLEPQAIIIAEKRDVTKNSGADHPTAQDSNFPYQPLWSRRIELPFRIDPEKANAKSTNGILRIELPKAATDGVRKIAIN